MLLHASIFMHLQLHGAKNHISKSVDIFSEKNCDYFYCKNKSFPVFNRLQGYSLKNMYFKSIMDIVSISGFNSQILIYFVLKICADGYKIDE